MNKAYNSLELATLLNGHLEGEARPVTGLSSFQQPRQGTVVVVNNYEQIAALEHAPISALIIPESLKTESSQPHIQVGDTRLALAKLSAIFAPEFGTSATVSPQAQIDPSVKIGRDVNIAPGAIIGADSVIGDRSFIAPGCVIGQGVSMGKDCVLHANVTIYDGVELGSGVILHSGVVIGSDGFGYALNKQKAIKIHHLGSVVIADDVEIGANSCVDRGTLNATKIGARTKIDNLCQIGHNVQIGSDCLIAGLVGIAGSTVLGNNVQVGGGAGLADHLVVGDGAQIIAQAGVSKNIPAGEVWGGYPAEPFKKWMRKRYLVSKLEQIWQFVKGANKHD